MYQTSGCRYVSHFEHKIMYWHVPVRVWALTCRVLSGMKTRTLSLLMNNRHTISQKVIQCYSTIELITPSQYKHCKTRAVDTTPINARFLLQVKTVAGNRRWCVRGVNCFSEADAGSGFRLFSCLPRIIVYNSRYMMHDYTQKLADFPSYAVSGFTQFRKN